MKANMTTPLIADHISQIQGFWSAMVPHELEFLTFGSPFSCQHVSNGAYQVWKAVCSSGMVGSVVQGLHAQQCAIFVSCVPYACGSDADFIRDVQGLPPAEYEAKKESVADELVARVEAHLTGLAAATVFREVSPSVTRLHVYQPCKTEQLSDSDRLI